MVAAELQITKKRKRHGADPKYNAVATWQNQDITRAFQISGTRTLANVPPSDNATIEDLVGVGFVHGGVYEEGIALKNYASIMGGPLCYIYE